MRRLATLRARYRGCAGKVEMALRRAITVDDVCRWIQEGRGQGRYGRYRSWLPICRAFSSPVSFQYFYHLPLRATNYEWCSHVEFRTGIQLAWCGATELREGLPEWNHDHDHPASGTEQRPFSSSDRVEGLYSIAKRAGIPIGTFPGTKVPYVASCDHVCTWSSDVPLLFVSNKSTAQLASSERARERVELDRIYAASVGGHHLLETEVDFNLQLIENLRWICPLRSAADGTDPALLLDFSSKLTERLSVMPLGSAIKLSGVQFGLESGKAHKLFRLACWRGFIDIDLTTKILFRKFAARDGGRTRQRLREHYFAIGGAVR